MKMVIMFAVMTIVGLSGGDHSTGHQQVSHEKVINALIVESKPFTLLG